MNQTATQWYISKFPEALYPPSEQNRLSYASRVIAGRNLMSRSSVFICGVARDVINVLPYTIARIEKLGSMFRHFEVQVVENDSIDGTKELLKAWAKNDHVHLDSSDVGTRKLSDKSTERLINMANTRNKYLEAIQKSTHDFIIIVDFDIEGGWSYEGIANSFGQAVNWAVIGSNSLFYQQVNNEFRRIYYDTFALKLFEDRKDLTFNRGESLLEVKSCGGGLIIYDKRYLTKDTQYGFYDCDHITLNEQIIENGGKIYLNPSQITLYNRNLYNII